MCAEGTDSFLLVLFLNYQTGNSTWEFGIEELPMVSFMFVCVMCARSTAGNRTNLQAPVCLLVPAGSPGGSPKAQNGKKTLCFAQTMEMQGTDIGEPCLHLYPPSWDGVFISCWIHGVSFCIHWDQLRHKKPRKTQTWVQVKDPHLGMAIFWKHSSSSLSETQFSHFSSKSVKQPPNRCSPWSVGLTQQVSLMWTTSFHSFQYFNTVLLTCSKLNTLK